MSSWTSLGFLPPRDLVEARLELHHAVQLVSIAVGRSLVPHRDDDSHTALTWLAAAGQWVGEPIPGTAGVRAGLRPADLTLTVGDAADPAARRLALAGRTRDHGLAWLREQLAELGVDAGAVVLDFHFEMPAHAVAEGAAFRAGLAPGFQELARYYADGSLLLEEIAAGHAGASAVLTWPHHFDVGLVVSLGGDRTVGVGLSPGDETYAEPYFYVNAWPVPEDVEPPELPLGGWQTANFFAAVLTATELLADGEEDQATRARAFLAAAVEAARALVSPPSSTPSPAPAPGRRAAAT